MRITNSLLQSRILRDLQGNLSSLSQAQSQISSGKRFEKVSEDPIAGASVMTSDRGLRGIGQYRRNSASARTRTDAEEAVLDQLTDLLTRAKQLAVQEGSATSTPTTRAGAKSEVDRIIEQVVSLGNTKVGSEYLFAGHLVSGPAFDAAGGYLGDDGQRQSEIGEGYLITTNHTGRELLTNSGIMTGLKSLSTQLGTGTPATIAGTLTALDTAFTNTQTLLATTGARVGQIDSAMQNSDALSTNLTLRRSRDIDTDIEEASTRLISLQTTLQASLQAASRILNTTLTDYLR
ncbi:MAG: flagellar hook-associated protein FlgL [Gemmatimonadales bacterium]